VMLIGLLAGAAVVRGETNANSTAAAAPAANLPGQGGAGTGQSLVAAAAKNVQNEVAISADMRYRVDAFGHQLLGTGSYLQQGAGTEKLVRLELKMQVGDRPATLQEIRGQEYYYIRREVPPGLTSLGRVNLRQLRQSIARTSDARPDETLPTDGWIMLGGLGRLLTALEGNFEFGQPTADELKFTAADGKSIERLPIWRVSGVWKKERLAALTGNDPSKPAAHLPEQMPDRVELILGRTEQVLPLFPYRITYTRAPEMPVKGQGGAGETSGPKELLTLEFFNVFRKVDIDPRLFEYNPGDQVVQDLTTAYVQRYSSETKLR
jgi:hypothetical protein